MMTKDVLLWILGLLGTTNLAVMGWILRWIFAHHKQCHSTPLQQLAVVINDIQTLKKEDRRLADNIHDIREDFSPMTAWSELAREIVLKSQEKNRGA